MAQQGGAKDEHVAYVQGNAQLQVRKEEVAACVDAKRGQGGPAVYWVRSAVVTHNLPI